MGLFDRVRNLVSASINDLLDKAEDPEKMVNQMVRNMEESIKELESSTAASLASAKMAMNKHARCVKERDEWQQNAERALEQGNEELAKKALVKKKSIEQNIEIYEQQASEANKLANHMKEEYRLMRDKLEEARAKREHLITKQKAADSRQKLHDDANKFDRQLDNVKSAYSSVSESSDMFSRMEEKIDKQMNEIEAREEIKEDQLEKEFASLNKNSDIDDELEALKSKINK